MHPPNDRSVARVTVALSLLAACFLTGAAGRPVWADGPPKSQETPAAKPDAASPTTQFRREELRYGGKDFAYWRRELFTELKPESRVEALRALATFGVNGYGAEAAEAIIELMRHYALKGSDEDETKVVDAARGGVFKIGRPAVPTLIDGLDHECRTVRQFSVEILKYLLWQEAAKLSPGSAEVKQAIPALLRALKDADAETRSNAFDCLQESPVDPEALASAVVANLQKAAPADYADLRAVGKLGAKAKAAVPTLVRYLGPEKQVIMAEGRPRDVRELAAETLGSIGTEAKPAVPALEALLRDPHADVREAVAQALSKIDPAKYPPARSGESAVPAPVDGDLPSAKPGPAPK